MNEEEFIPQHGSMAITGVEYRWDKWTEDVTEILKAECICPQCEVFTPEEAAEMALTLCPDFERDRQEFSQAEDMGRVA